MDTTLAAIRRPLTLRGLGGAIRLESLIVLIVLIVGLSIASPYFLSLSNAFNILLATSVIGILGFASTFVIAAAGIDLSIGSVLGFAAVVSALSVNAIGLPWPFAIVFALLAGGLCGVINGVLVARARIPAFIVTLGMLGVARGAGRP
jgi:ribose transport system permease protein